MAYTSAATAELNKQLPTINPRLELRTNFAASSSWDDIPYKSVEWEFADGEPDKLTVSGVNWPAFAYTDERDKTNRTQQFAHIRLTVPVGAESEVVFDGRIELTALATFSIPISALDWSVLWSECECRVSLEPDSVEVVASGSWRQVHKVVNADGSDYGFTFAFTPNGSGTDPAFDEDTQVARRSWQKTGNFAVARTNSGLPEDLVPSSAYEVDWASGAITIMEQPVQLVGGELVPVDPVTLAERDYYLTAVRAYKESSATGATNCDYARIVEQAWTYAAADGGMGLTAAHIDLQDFGLDLPQPFIFPRTEGESAFVSDLLRVLAGILGEGFKAWYSSRTLKHTARFIRQKPAGLEDWALLQPRAVQIPKLARDVASRVVCTGWNTRETNILGRDGGSWTDHQAASDWEGWNGDPSSETDFSSCYPLAYDSNLNKGFIIHNIAGAGLDEWHDMLTRDFGEVLRLQLIDFTFPASRSANPLAGQGHFGVFWPGIQALTSTDNVNFHPAAAELNRVRQRPGSRIKVSGDQITNPYCRYLKLVGGTYKFGSENYGDPGMGIGELIVSDRSHYRIEKVCQGSDALAVYRYSNNRAYAIAAADAAADTFRVDGVDLRYLLPPGSCFVVEGSAAAVHDTTWFVETVSYAGGNSTIAVTGNVISASATGRVRPAVSTYNPTLLERLGTAPDGGQRHKTKYYDFGDKYSEVLAHDPATQLFGEHQRMFLSYDFASAVADPRPEKYDTLSFTDPATNVSGSFLCLSGGGQFTGGEPSKPGTMNSRFRGTDYLQPNLGNDP